ncbi:MAG: hypothetical protein ACTSUE_02880 [Promethearchaeota archaeon]
MKVSFLIPVKNLSRGKSRLAVSIAGPDGGRFQKGVTTALIKDLLEVLMDLIPRVEGWLDVHFIVCSSDGELESMVMEMGEPFFFMHEREFWHELENIDDVERLDNIIHCINQKSIDLFDPDGSILIMNDLPLLQVADLVVLLERLKERVEKGAPGIYISPSPGNGCNLLARFPPEVITTKFGDPIHPSFIANLKLARKKSRELNIPQGDFIEIANNLAFYLDFDTPDDILHILPILEETKKDSNLLKLLKQFHLKIEKECDKNNRKINFSLRD